MTDEGDEAAQGYGTRAQYSVFECELEQRDFDQLGRKLKTLIDLSTDSVRCYRLDTKAINRSGSSASGR